MNANDETNPELPPGLEPCPFCGGTHLELYRSSGYWIRCLDCGCDGPTWGRDAREAAEKWNHRASGDPTSLRETLVWIRDRLVAGIHDGTMDCYEAIGRAEAALAANPSAATPATDPLLPF